MKGSCEICGTEIDVQMCCSGKDCGCLGLPIEPPVCSIKCLKEYEIKLIKERAEQPFVTARFGDKWKEHIKEQFEKDEIDIDSIINIAWKQGRAAILLEDALRKKL